MARQLDEDELATLITGNPGNETAIRQEFLKGGSNNYDDSGFFSLSVIEKALMVFNLSLIPIGSKDPIAVQAKEKPEEQRAFILNLAEHWFTIRKFGHSSQRWYNLNSIHKEPTHVSNTYLGLLLNQMQTEGYSIFIVAGELVETDADFEANLSPIPPPEALIKSTKKQSSNEDDDDLQKALRMSMGENVADDDELQQALRASMMDSGIDNESLAMAISASLQEAGPSKGTPDSSKIQASIPQQVLSPEDIRRKRLERFGNK